MKVAQAIAGFLKEVGIRWVFGVPGTDLVPIIRCVELDPSMFYIRVPNEQEIPAIAAGSFLGTGRIPAFFVAPPGLFNLLGSLPHLVELQIPAVCICGVPSSGRRPYLQDEAIFPLEDVSRPLFEVVRLNPKDLQSQLSKVLEALSKRKQVLMLVTLSLLELEVDVSFPYPTLEANQVSGDMDTFFSSFVEERKRSSRGVVVLGSCIQRFGAEAEAERLLERLKLPYVFTTSGLPRVFSPGCAGLIGWAGYPDTIKFVEGLEYVLSIGDRLGSISSSGMRLPQKIYGICGDYELFEGVSISGDIKIILDRFCSFIDGLGLEFPPFEGDIPHFPEGGSYASFLEGLDKPLRFSQFFYRFLKGLREDRFYSIFVGHSRYLLELINIACSMRRRNVKYHTSIYYGWMGWAISAAMGYAFSKGDDEVVCFVGDGTFYMHTQCLLTVRDFSLPVLIVVLNNGRYSMIDMTYRRLYGESSDVSMATSRDDLVGEISKGYGIPSVRVCDRSSCEELLVALQRGDLSLPLVVDLVLDPEDHPMLMR